MGVQYIAAVFYYDSEWKPLGNAFYFTVAAPVYSSDATLKNLVVKDAQTQSPLALTPAFSPTITSYIVTATNETTGISITGEANHKRATFTNIENQLLSGGNTFNIKVTAEDKTTEKTYTVTVVQGNPPVPGNSGGIDIANVTMQDLTLNWAKATDDVTSGANLKYYVYQSTSNNVNTVGDCKTNGTLLNTNGTVDIDTYSVTGLMSNATYYFNVVAENEIGNVANETGPYLYFPAPPPDSDRYSVLLTTGGQTLPVCSSVQIKSAAVQPDGLLAYPNPARYAITVENTQWETAKQTDLINLSGNVVRSYPSARIQTLNVSGLPVGLYILRAGVHTTKIVIE